MRKLYAFSGICLPIFLLMTAMVPCIKPVRAQCNLSLNNSAGGNTPGGTLTVSSTGSTIQRVRWYRDGSLIRTEEAAWNTSSPVTLMSGPGTQVPKTNLFIPQLAGYKDTVFIADYNNRIWKWWPGQSSPVMILGDANGAGVTPPAGALAPCFIFIPSTSADTIFFAEWDGKGVFEWDRRNGTFTRRVGNGYFPTSVAVRNDTVYTSDYHNHVVRKFNRGYVNPGINVVTGATNTRIVLFHKDSMYVVAAGSVRKFGIGGTYAFTSGRLVAGGSVGAGLNQFNDAQSMHIDSLGNIFIADGSNHRIVKWTPDATTGVVAAGITGSAGTGAGQLNSPNKVWISNGGYLYVSDGHRVLQYSHVLDNTTGSNVTGVYKAVIDGFNGCRDSISITITAGPAQPGNFIASKTPVCKEETGAAYRINRVTGATSYNWAYTPSAGVTITPLTDTSVTLAFSATAASGTLSVTAVNSSGQSPLRSLSIIVNNLPVIAPISGNMPVCIQETRTLSTTPTGGTWSSGTPANATINGTGAVSGVATGSSVITYSYTDANSCTNTATTTVTVNALPAVSVTPTGTQTICQGDSLLLTATATGVTYQWKEGTTNTGTGTNRHYAKTNGSYTVTVTNTTTNCSTTSTPATALTVHALPTATVTPAGPVDICTPDSVMLTAGSGYTYQWKNGPVPVGTGGTYTAKTTGSYRLIVTDGTTLCKDSTQAVSVTVHNMPVVSLTPGDTAFCEGGAVTMHISTRDTGLSYLWLKNGSPIPSATADFYETDETGFYELAVTRNMIAGCTDTSAPLAVTVHPLPAPVATWDGERFHAAPYYVSYQWNTGSQPIAGATDATFRPVTDGGYSVTVTDSNGCSGISPIVHADKVGIDPQSALAGQIRIYPNPARTDIHIQSPVPVRAVLTNMEGRKVWSGTGVQQISIENLADGIYFLLISDDAGFPLKQEKLIKKSL